MHEEESLIRLGRIEGKLDDLVERVDGKLKDHEARIRRHEYTMWSVSGALAVIGAKVGWPHILSMFPH